MKIVTIGEQIRFCVSFSGDSSERPKPKQEVGVAVSLQEEVGLSRGAGPHRGGAGGAASTRPPRIQAQEILPLRRNAVMCVCVCECTFEHC